MELSQERIPEPLISELKEAREQWRHREYPTNPSALSHIAMNEVLDKYNEWEANTQEFEEWIMKE